MHLRAGVVQRRDQQKHVVLGLAVVVLFRHGRVHQRLVLVQNGLREARGAGGIVDGAVVLVAQLDWRGLGGAVGHQCPQVLREGGTLLAVVDPHFHVGHLGIDVLDPAHELRAEHDIVRVRLVDAVFDLLGGIAVVQRHHDGAGLQHAEVDGQPLDAVHHQHGGLVAFFDAAAQQQVRDAVGVLVELAPGHLPAVGFRRVGDDQGVVPPGHQGFFLHFGVDLHQRHVVGVEIGVLLQDLGQRHSFLSFRGKYLHRKTAPENHRARCRFIAHTISLYSVKVKIILN